MVYSVKDAADFDDQVKKADDKIVVAEFFATWCGPCKMIRPAFEKLAEKYSAHIAAVEVDTDECAALTITFKIESKPTFVFLKNGEKIGEWSGSNEIKLEEIIKQQINQRKAIA